MKVARILVILSVVLGLTLGSMGNVFAAEPSLIPVFNISGTVVEIGETNNAEGFIELKTGEGHVRILVTTETKYDVPGKEQAALADIKVGDRTKIVAIKADVGLIASTVKVLPQFVYRHQLVRKAQIELPPQQIKQVWLHLPRQQIKRVLIPLPEQVKEIWLHIPPQQIKQVWLDIVPAN